MECKHAYQALSDTKQRSRYDREQVLSHDSPLVSKICTRRAALRTLLWRLWACLSCIQPALRWWHGPENRSRRGNIQSGGCALRVARGKQAADWPPVALQTSSGALLSPERDTDPANTTQRGGVGRNDVESCGARKPAGCQGLLLMGQLDVLALASPHVLLWHRFGFVFAERRQRHWRLQLG